MKVTETSCHTPRVGADASNPCIGTLIDLAAKRWPTDAAVVDPVTGSSMNYRQLMHRSRAVAGWLETLGLSKGSKVVLAAGNSVAALELLSGAMYGRFVPVPCNPDLGPEQLAFLLDHCDGEFLFASRENVPVLERALRRCRRRIELIEVGDSLQLPESDVRPVPGASDDDALIIYTSGTTGVPKGVLHSTAGKLAAMENTASTYGLSPEDRFLCVLPVHHGNSIHKVFATWLTGGTVVLPPRFEVRKFWRWVDDQHCTWLALVPSIISQLLKFGGAAPHPSVRFARSSSAPLPKSWHREFEERFGIALLEGMGATEAGPLFSSPRPPSARKIGSPGKSVFRQEVRIVDEDENELPDNERGLIIVRGPSLMKGYYKDTTATASALTTAGFFRTGDIGYRDSEGFYFVTGRAKEIVIKAGVNIALREIDDALVAHPAVKDAASAGIEDAYLGEDVAAYVVVQSDQALSDSDLLDFCVDKLGSFKAPGTIVRVAEIPRLPNGKVRRFLLRERFGPPNVPDAERLPRAANSRPFVAPRTPMERILARVWAEHLGEASVGIHDDFFALGGYSLLAIRMLAPLRRQLGTALSLTAFFEHPNIADQALIAATQLLSQLPSSERRSLPCARLGIAMPGDSTDPDWEWGLDAIEALAQDDRVALDRALLERSGGGQPAHRIPPRGVPGSCPLSFAQERIWFMGEMSPESSMYNTGDAVRLRGALDVEALERALNALTARHEILRASISVVDGQPRQHFRAPSNITVRRLDLTHLHERERESQLRRIIQAELQHRFTLDEESLVRATVAKLDDDDHAFIFSGHHIVSDGWSTRILLRELEALYSDEIHGAKSQLPSLPIQYGDFAIWQRNRLDGERIRRESDYWSQRLHGVPTLLDLPADRPRPRVQSHRGKRQRFCLPDGVSSGVRETSRGLHVSAFTTLSGAFAALLYRYSGQSDFVIGLPFADRDRPELQYVVGLLLDTHVIRFSISDEVPIRDVITHTRSEVAESYAHRDLPFELVVDAVQPHRNLGYMPLCQVVVTWREPSTRMSSLTLEGLSTRPLLPHDGTSKFDLNMTFSDVGTGMEFEIEYATDLFEAATIERMAGHYERLLEAVIEDPTCPVGTLPMLTEAERRELLIEWNDTTREYPREETVHGLLGAQARRTPDAIALVCEGRSLSYGELARRVTLLARHLRALGVASETLVGLCVPRSLEMVVGLLGILEAGGAYVPLDPDYPAARLAYMLADTEAPVVLTQREVADRLPASGATRVDLDGFDWSRAPPDTPLAPGVGSENLAYIMYTSGSTGQPKGAMISHRGLLNYCSWAIRYYRVADGSGTLLHSSLAFDLTITSLFPPLLCGKRVTVVPEEGGIEALSKALRQSSGLSLVKITPAHLDLVSSQLPASTVAGMTRALVIGGDALFGMHLEFWRKYAPQTRLINEYGPTETVVGCCVHEVTPESFSNEAIPIGRPIANTRAYVLDANMQPVPIGVIGELHVGGAGVARGYLNRPDLTAESFVRDPFGARADDRLYRTGDLARYRADGTLEFQGRVDHQIKLRGHRIELGEIEAVLGRHERVQTCAVSLREDMPGDQRLTAYVVPTAGPPPFEAEALRSHLKAELPAYMVPADYVTMDALPLTANGKLDRQALPAPDPSARALPDGPVAPRTPTEQILSDIWAELLGLEQVGVQDDFFELGGHSLLAVRIVNRVNEALKTQISLAHLFDAPTVEALATLVADGDGTPMRH